MDKREDSTTDPVQDTQSSTIMPDKKPEILSGIAHPERRATLAVLLQKAQPVTIDELAKELCTVYTNPDISIAPKDELSIETILYHRDAPTLEELGLITFNTETDTISLNLTAEQKQKLENTLRNYDNWKL